MRKYADLTTVIVLSLALGAIGTVSGWAGESVLRVAGISLALFLPGYALQAALFAGRSMGRLEQVALSLGLSLAIMSLAGLVLSALRISIRAETMSLTLLIVTIMLAGMAMLRRRGHAFMPDNSPARPQVNIAPAQALLLAGAAVIALVAFWVAALPSSQQGIQSYTALWMKPHTGISPQSMVEVGINSQEFSSTTFRVELIADGRLVREWPDIRLEPGETWVVQFNPADDAPAAKVLQANLLKDDARDEIYRHVILRGIATPDAAETSVAP